jgi:putative transposase
VCRLAGQPRSTQRYRARGHLDEEQLRQRIVALALDYGAYGYRMLAGLLRGEGLLVNHKRVERIWRQEGLKVPRRQPKRRRLWLNDGSCVRLRAQRPNHVWSYDFVAHRTHDKRVLKLLTVMDEFTRECLAIKVARRLRSHHVKEQLCELFLRRGLPEHIRSDNGPEFTAKKIKGWLAGLSVQTQFITPGSPWENGYIESFNGKLRFELLNREIFDTLKEAEVIIESWRHHYNTVRPHSALRWRPPAPEAFAPADPPLQDPFGKLGISSPNGTVSHTA